MINIIKSAEPLIALLFCRCVLGQKSSRVKQLAMVPTLLGITLCNMSDASFSLVGLLYCLVSCLFHVIKGVYSKTVFVDKLDMSSADIMYITTVGSAILALPSLIAQHEIVATAFFDQTTTLNFLLSCLGYYVNSACAFEVMARVDPVTYSWTNIYKRLFVIVLAMSLQGQGLGLQKVTGLFLTGIGLVMFNHRKKAVM